MFGIVKKLFGTAQTRLLRKYQKIVSQVNALEVQLQNLTQEELTNKTLELREQFQNGKSVDDLLPEAYAVVKNQCRRLCGTQVHVSGYDQEWDMIPYDVQILGAIAMHYGAIAEMQTGEGKTLTASMPLYLNALTGKPVHLVTVNDYLAKRDCEWIGTVFRHLGLNVASLTNDVPVYERKEVYQNDIVYGTASEFGFDYLRDNSMSMRKEDQCQRGHYFAIVDEIDSILIDEARTPLIISGPSSEKKQMYHLLQDNVSQVVRMQRELCNKLASEAKKVIDTLEETAKPSKEDQEKLKYAYRKLWQVLKGTPRNKVLKRTMENPDLRAKIEQWENYFVSDQNKEEKAAVLSELFIIVDEKSSEYELTDKGIQQWSEFDDENTRAEDFIMLDLGYEYAQIDQTDLSDNEKMAQKVVLREEDAKRKERSHNLRQLFRAHLLMEKDVDYIVQDQKIIIIDENTGRPQPGRRFSDGLHQAIEAKESVEIQGETQTYATITLQNYFRMYDKLAGMTGTAITEAHEFKEIYKLEVLEIPTYKPCKRKDFDDRIYMTEREKYHAILKEIQEINNKGCPILIGTESVEISEKLSRILKQNHLPHTVLNAKNHEHEAEIIAKAGHRGAITIATNMAGRGTDIKLQEGIPQLGGLHVIGTTRHQSRRIDRQLRGRCARLGDPGTSMFFISFEDSLMRLFASPRITSLLQRFRPPEGEPISAKVLNKSIETAQKRVEQRNYTIRKHTLEYDDVMNKQRKEIYSFRNDILWNENPIQLVKDVLQELCYHLMDSFYQEKQILKDPQGFKDQLVQIFPLSFQEIDFSTSEVLKLEKQILDQILQAFTQKIHAQKQLIFSFKPETPETEVDRMLQELIRNISLRNIDRMWQEHLLAIDHLRSDVSLRTVGQKDPLMEFKQEAFRLFEALSLKLKKSIGHDLFRFEIIAPQEEPEVPPEQPLSDIQLHTDQSFIPEESTEEEPEQESSTAPVQNSEPKVGRNDLCPCGSGEKYKKCCAKKTLV